MDEDLGLSKSRPFLIGTEKNILKEYFEKGDSKELETNS